MSEDSIDEGQLHSDHIEMMRSYGSLHQKISSIDTKVEKTLVLVSKLAERQTLDQERTEREIERLRLESNAHRIALASEAQARGDEIKGINGKINMAIGGLAILGPLALFGIQALVGLTQGGGA